MSIKSDILEGLNQSIQSSSKALKLALIRLRTGRANVVILDGVRINYYGNMTTLNQCASVKAINARLIIIKPFDKNIIDDIEKSITKANLGLNPQSDGEVIRLPIPALTGERREELVKQAKARCEEGKISIRNARRDANEMLKKAEKKKDISQDELKRSIIEVQSKTDISIKQIDSALDAKKKEILEI